MHYPRITFDGVPTHRVATIEQDAHDGSMPEIQAVAGDLLAHRNGVAAISVPGFVTREACTGLLHGLRLIQMPATQSNHEDSCVASFGPSQNHPNFNHDQAAYFAALEQWQREPGFIAATSPQKKTTGTVLAFLTGAFGRQVRPARQEERELSPAVVRTIDHTTLHIDDHRAHTGWQISKLQKQFAWNVYLSVGDEGGETVVYGYSGYDGDMLRRVPQVELRPATGDLIVFNSGLVHQVKESTPKGQRITVNGQLAVYGDGDDIESCG